MEKEIFKRFIICMICMIILAFLPLWYFSYVSFWKWNVEYDQCEEDFNCVKDYMLSMYPDEENKCVIVTQSKGDIYLTDLDTGERLNIDDEIKASLEKIASEGFVDKDSNLDAIRIQGERVSFEDDGPYMFVFSPNERPKYFNINDEDEKISVKKEAEDWYHVRKR